MERYNVPIEVRKPPSLQDRLLRLWLWLLWYRQCFERSEHVTYWDDAQIMDNVMILETEMMYTFGFWYDNGNKGRM